MFALKAISPCILSVHYTGGVGEGCNAPGDTTSTLGDNMNTPGDVQYTGLSIQIQLFSNDLPPHLS